MLFYYKHVLTVMHTPCVYVCVCGNMLSDRGITLEKQLQFY